MCIIKWVMNTADSSNHIHHMKQNLSSRVPTTSSYVLLSYRFSLFRLSLFVSPSICLHFIAVTPSSSDQTHPSILLHHSPEDSIIAQQLTNTGRKGTGDTDSSILSCWQPQIWLERWWCSFWWGCDADGDVMMMENHRQQGDDNDPILQRFQFEMTHKSGSGPCPN